MTMMHAEFRVERLSGLGGDRNTQTDRHTDRQTHRQKNGNEKLVSPSALEDPVPAVNCRVGITVFLRIFLMNRNLPFNFQHVGWMNNGFCRCHEGQTLQVWTIQLGSSFFGGTYCLDSVVVQWYKFLLDWSDYPAVFPLWLYMLMLGIACPGIGVFHGNACC